MNDTANNKVICDLLNAKITPLVNVLEMDKDQLREEGLWV